MTVVDDIKTRLDIVDLVSQYVPLQQSGASFKGLCPFHTEKTPSFFVFPNRQTWRCFGACATGGDAFSFYMQKENVDFSQALKGLAQITGVDLPTRRTALKDDSLYKINDAAARFFSRYLASPEGIPARDYVKERGLTQDTVDSFQLGLSPGDGYSLKRHLLSLGYAEGQLALAGLLAQSSGGAYQDLFRRRLMFPIWDPQGRLAGFGGRALDDSNPKYLNSRQGPVFDKGRILFGFHLAQKAIKERGVVVVEGYMDAIVAHQGGFSNVVASMGTSLTRHQAALLQDVTKEVVLALDPDAAGQEATLRSLESSWQVMQRRVMARSQRATLYERPSGPNLKIAPLPQGKDPDEIILENPSHWEQLTTEAVPLMEFLFKALSAKFDLSTAQGKAQVAEMLFPLVAATPDHFEQDRHFRNLAQLLGVSEATLEAGIGRPRPQRTRSAGPTAVAATPFERLEKDPLEEHCLALLIQNPRLEPLASNLRREQFQRVENRE
ncbi:MAG: DNA primase, partial [Dehalococcoidia bacterium]